MWSVFQKNTLKVIFGVQPEYIVMEQLWISWYDYLTGVSYQYPKDAKLSVTIRLCDVKLSQYNVLYGLTNIETWCNYDSH